MHTPQGLYMRDKADLIVGESMVLEVKYSQNGFCGGCKTRLDSSAVIQHRVPKSLGGTKSIENLIALCKNCKGYIPKSMRLPKHLFVRYQKWKEEQNIDASFSTIVRDILSQSIEKGHLITEENRNQKAEINELKQKIQYLELQLRQKNRKLEKIHKLSH